MRPEASDGRLVAAAVMGCLAFGLVLLLAAAAGIPVTAVLIVAGLAGAGLIALWLERRAASVRSAWGHGCLFNGLLSAAVAVSLQVQDEPWLGGSSFAQDLDRAIGPLTHFVWALAARAGLVALILAAVLVALSYWLLGPPHRKA